MDFGISGKRAIVCAASRGLGRACAQALAEAGVYVVITGRDEAALDRAAAQIGQATGVRVLAAAGDITTPEGRAAALAVCPDPDILVNNAGGPPAGDFRNFTAETWQAALNANMISQIELIKAVIDPMIARKFGRIINITSAAVKSPIAALALSNGARTGLTAFAAGLAREVARHNVTVNGLLPGPFNTDRLRAMAENSARQSGRTVAQELALRGANNPAGRIGEPGEFGAACAFFCSVHAGFITGQNLLLDGGAFNSTL